MFRSEDKTTRSTEMVSKKYFIRQLSKHGNNSFNRRKKNDMKQVYLTRMIKSKIQITGILYYQDENDKLQLLQTLELPNNKNKSNTSCIPVGTYTCIYTWSAKFKKFTYELIDVPNKKGIRFHSGNYTQNTKGCILLGMKTGFLNKDKEIDMLDSRKAITQFETDLHKQPFTLIIK